MSKLSLFALVSAALLSSATPSVVEQSPVFRSAVHTLPIDVSVHAGDGHFVRDLERDDFLVSVNGKPREVTVFNVEARPLSMVVMVDTSQSVSLFSVNRASEGRVPHYKAVLELVGGLGPLDRVRIGSFGLRVAINPSWTRDAAEAERILLEEMWAGGGSPVWQALAEAITTLDQEPGRRVVVAFTDGIDTGNTKTGQGSIGLVSRQADEAGVVLYAIRPPGVRQAMAERMKALVTGTGGRVFEPAKSEEVGEAVRRVTEELRHQYALGVSLDSAESVRSLEVRVRNDRLNVTLHGGSARFASAVKGRR